MQHISEMRTPLGHSALRAIGADGPRAVVGREWASRRRLWNRHCTLRSPHYAVHVAQTDVLLATVCIRPKMLMR